MVSTCGAGKAKSATVDPNTGLGDAVSTRVQCFFADREEESGRAWSFSISSRLCTPHARLSCAWEATFSRIADSN